MAIHGGPAGAEVGLADTHRDMHGLSQLGWKYPWASPGLAHFSIKLHFSQKTQFFVQRKKILASISDFCTKNVDFSTTPRLFSLEAQGLDDLTGHPGDPNRGQTRFLRASPLRNSANPGRSWPKSVRRRKRASGNTPCLTTDGRFEAKLPPQTPRLAPQTPREASPGALEKIVFLFFLKFGMTKVRATYSPSPVAASRPRGAARRADAVS